MDRLIEFIGNHTFLSASFLALLTLLIFSELRRSRRGFNDLTPNDAVKKINHERAVLLDIREPKELSEGQIVNAIHAPLSELDQHIKKLDKYKKKPIIVYCRTGTRSQSACSKLQKEGFETVYNLRGGITAWQRDSLPIVHSTK